MADAYNVDIEGLRQKGEDAGYSKRREDEIFKGGLYPHQRNLFDAVAKLNHCLYWYMPGTGKGQKYQHRLVGSKINVMLAKQMGDYLQSTVERLAREWVGDPSLYFTRSAHSYRRGVVDRLIRTINEKRREDAAEAKAKAARAPVGGNQLVTLDDVARREEEANYDFLYGEGVWAKAQARMAEWLKRQEEAREAMKEWEAANPEEAARQKAEAEREEAKRVKAEERNAKRRKGRVPPKSKLDFEAYWDGHLAGAKVRLDKQIDEEDRAGQLAIT
jgi:hypothetical protein